MIDRSLRLSSVIFATCLLMVGCQSEDKSTTSDSPAAETEADSSNSETPSGTPQASSDQPEADGQQPPTVADAGPSIVVDSPQPVLFVPPDLSIEEIRDGWISLFDGISLYGWEKPGTANWRVEDGSIVADQGDVSLLSTPFAFGDFEFRCQFQMEAGGNSGVFLRTAADPANPATDTYELNICDDHPDFPTGSLVGRIKVDDVPEVTGDWHEFYVVCDGNKITVELDGRRILDFTDSGEHVRKAGSIGLQFNKGRIAFRDVFLRPLNQQALFNRADQEGWHEVPGGSSTFQVSDGILKVQDGPGFLETDQTFDDFILHIEANIHDQKAIADNRPANSGVFFRTLRGTEDAPSHGYEIQIQHDFKDGDRSAPLDFGSGAIYRRKEARYVVANNNEWVVQTLIAQHNRFATFVNGYQVLMWIDDRKPDENPRKGQRLEAGHISLQGHDPTTDIEIRSIRLHELPAMSQ